MDNIQATCQKARQLPHELLTQTPLHQVARKVPDTEILEQTGMFHAPQGPGTMGGHAVRMPNHRLPKQIFYGELWDGKRTVGEQKKEVYRLHESHF